MEELYNENYFRNYLLKHVQNAKGFHLPEPVSVKLTDQETKHYKEPGMFTRNPAGEYGSDTYSYHIDAHDLFTEYTMSGMAVDLIAEESFDRNQLLHLHHDFPMKHWLGKETDKKISEMFCVKLNDGGNNKTPDYHVEFVTDHDHRTKTCVIELSTTQSNDPAILDQDFMKKKTSYEGVLKARYNQQHASLGDKLDVFYYIICLSKKGMVTNLPGSFTEIRRIAVSLVNRFRAMVAFDNFISGIEKVSFMYTKLSNSNLHGIKQFLSEIQYHYEDKYFTKEFLDYVQSPVDQVKFNETFESEAFRVMKNDPRFKRSQDHYNTRKAEVSSHTEVEPERKISDARFVLNESTCPSLFKHFDTIKKGGTSDSHFKRIIGFPLAFPTVDRSCDTHIRHAEEFNIAEEPLSYMEHFWQSALLEAKKKEQFYDRNEDLLMHLAKENLEPDSENLTVKERRLRVALDLNVSLSARLQAALVGVEAKCSKLMEDPMVREKRRDSKKSLNPDCSTTDIFDFFNDADLLEEVEGRFIPDKLIEEYLSDENMLKGVSSVVQFYNKTRLSSWLRFISAIASELAVSGRTNMNEGQFGLRKLKDYNCLMLLKTTNQKEHTYFSLCFRKDAICEFDKTSYRIGTGLIDSGDCLITPFRSLKPDRIGHLVKADSMGLAMLSNYLDLFPVSYDDVTKITTSRIREKYTIIEMKIALDTLIFLECKPCTEEVISLTRYAGMESLTASFYKPNSTKVIKKLPNVIRSRLQLYMIKRLSSWSCQLETEHYRPKWNVASATFENLHDMMTGKALPDLNAYVHSFYEGYLCSKDLGSEKNMSFKLIEKILKYEVLHRKLKDRRPNYHMTEPEGDPLEHEYSPNFLKGLAKFFQDQWRTTDPKLNELEEEILESFVNVKWSDLLTLKAAAKYNEQTLDEPNYSELKKYKESQAKSRPTVLEAVFKARKEMNLPIDATVFDHALQALRELNAKGGISVDLFKKPQHGGLREIYVLEVRARLVQIYIERIAKVLCRKFDSEIMTHPKNKYYIPQNHLLKGKTTHKTVTLSYAADASKWNQVHFVPKFALFMMNITPELFHPFIWNAMQLWVNKRIEIPIDLINFFIEDPYSQSSNAIYTALRSDFLTGSNNLMGASSRGMMHVIIESGMMQGILHFTSSLMHTVYQEWLKLVISQTLSKIKILTKISTQQSSDDSSLIITWIFTEEKYDTKQIQKALTLMEYMFYYKDALGRYIGIMPSLEKSTPCLLNSVEFNSEYFFGSSWIRPTNRWVYASLTSDMVETFCDRFENFSNLITQCLEGGASASLCSLAQIAQVNLHYTIMGETINKTASTCLKEVIKQKDPSVGYFPFTPTCVAGLFGFNFDLFVLAKGNNQFSKNLKLWLQQNEKEGCQEIKIGPLNKRFKIMMSNRTKFKALLARMKVELDWRDYFRNTPELFFRDAENSTEVTAITMYKLFSPGVVSSLSKYDSIYRTMAAGIYMYTKCVFQDGNNWSSNEPHQKSTLAHLIFKRPRGTEKLSTADMLQLFPNYYEYDRAYGEVINFLRLSPIPQAMSVRMRTRLEIVPQNEVHLFPLLSVLRSHWFGHNLRMSKDQFRVLVATLGMKYPWIKPTFKESLESFDPIDKDPISFYSYISQVDYSKPRAVFIINSSAVKNENVNLHSVITRFQWKNTKFGSPGVTSSRGNEDTSLLSSATLRHNLFCVVKMPLTPDHLRSELSIINSHYRDILGKEVFVGDSTAPLRVMLDFNDERFAGGNTSAIFTEAVASSKKGLYGMFTHRQPYNKMLNKYEGLGVWFGMISSTVIKIVIWNDDAVAIILDKTDDIIEIGLLLPGLCKDLRILGFSSSSESVVRDQIFGSSPSVWKMSRSGLVNATTVPEHCPVLTNVSMHKVLLDPEACYLESDGERLRLRLHPKECVEPLTVLSHQIRPRDYQPEIFTLLNDNEGRPLMLKEFSQGQSMHSNFFSFFAAALKRGDAKEAMFKVGLVLKGMKQFVADMIRNELVSVGIISDLGMLLSSKQQEIDRDTKTLESHAESESTHASKQLQVIDLTHLMDADNTDLDWAAELEKQVDPGNEWENCLKMGDINDELQNIMWKDILEMSFINQEDLFKLTQTDVRIRESVFSGCKLLSDALMPLLRVVPRECWEDLFLRQRCSKTQKDTLGNIIKVLPFKVDMYDERLEHDTDTLIRQMQNKSSRY